MSSGTRTLKTAYGNWRWCSLVSNYRSTSSVTHLLQHLRWSILHSFLVFLVYCFMFLVCSVFLAVASICLFHFCVTPRYIAVLASSSVWCVRKPICDIVFCVMSFLFRCFDFLLSCFEFLVYAFYVRFSSF